jgi:hypothetical protein
MPLLSKSLSRMDGVLTWCTSGGGSTGLMRVQRMVVSSLERLLL